MDNPLVSILLPAYNSAATIEESLQSVLAQTEPRWELIIIDDGSTDATLTIAESFAANDERIRLFRREAIRPEAKGAPVCRNIGLAHARGEFVVYLDADDLLAPHCLKRRLAAFGSDSALDFMVFRMRDFRDRVDDTGPIKNRPLKGNDDNYLKMFLRIEVAWQTTCPMWRRAFLEKIGGFSEDYSRLQDIELNIRALTEPGVRFAVIGDEAPDCFYRLSPNSKVASHTFIENGLKVLELALTRAGNAGLDGKERLRNVNRGWSHLLTIAAIRKPLLTAKTLDRYTRFAVDNGLIAPWQKALCTPIVRLLQPVSAYLFPPASRLIKHLYARY